MPNKMAMAVSAAALRSFRSRTDRAKPRPELTTMARADVHSRGLNLPDQPVRQAGSELYRHDPDEDHDGGQHELPPARTRLDIPEMDYPGRCFYSHLKVRAARVIPTHAQISSA